MVGEPYRHLESFAADPEAGSFALAGPDGKAVPFNTDLESGRLRLHIPRPEQPGLYEFHRGKERFAVAVNVDPRESDLRRIDSATLLKHFEGHGAGFEVRNATGWDPLFPTGGHPFWGSCLVAAMCAIAVELLLVGLWRR